MPLPSNTDLNTVLTPGDFYCDGATGANRPANNIGAFSLSVKNTGSWGGKGRSQTFIAYDSGYTYMRVFQGNSGGSFTDWVKIPITTPPQEYDIPLADGFAGYAKYSKNQFGQVLITLQDIVFSSGASFEYQNTLIGTLPAGFRPIRSIFTPAVATGASGVPIVGVFQLWVESNGSIYALLSQNTTPKMLRGILMFQPQS